MKPTIFATAAAALCAAAASGQVVINEIFENPVGGSNDDLYEYIEFYGTPGMDLTGYAVALLKGGQDPDGNNIPDIVAEIDEAFTLDGLSIGPNGFLVIYNRVVGFSEVGAYLDGPFAPAANSAGWGGPNLGVPTVDVPGKLGNDGSSTYLLVRTRPFHAIDENGMSLYDGSTGFFLGTRYSFRKDINPDVNFDGKIDFAEQGFAAVDPLQIVDEFAWSNAGGKEYVRSSEQEISDTPGFNPDGASRLRYYAQNPMLGHRINAMGDVVPTRTADESWVYGENPSVLAVLNGAMETTELVIPYNPALVKGPTDQNGPTYNAMGLLDPSGEFLFDDINLDGFMWTPGNFNDSAAAGVTQFRFLTGDVNFDGISDADDFLLARAWNLDAATLDDRVTLINDNNTPEDPMDDFAFEGFVFEGRLFNGYLAATNINTADGPMGTNAPVVTAQDVTTLRIALGAGVAPDQNNSGTVDAADLAILLAGWGGTNPFIDVNADGTVNAADLAVLLAGWGSQTP